MVPAPKLMKNPDETAMIKMPKPIRTAQTASKTVFVIAMIFRAFSGECKSLSGLFSRLRPYVLLPFWCTSA
jgi:hypothetical protein